MFGKCDGRWLVCVVVLLFQLATESNGNWLKNFAKPKQQLRLMEGVTEHLHNVMPYEQVQFSNPNVSTAYVSSTKFQAAGMGHLYFITNKFIQYILNDQAFPEGKQLSLCSTNIILIYPITIHWLKLLYTIL